MKLYLVRHGQSTGNIGGALMGQSDHPLTPLGEDQARAAAARLAPHGPMPVYSSDLPRARSTAERIASSWTDDALTGAPRVVLDPRLREISLGDYEGRPWQEFEADTDLTAAFAADPYRTALPNGESLEHLEARVHAAVLDILAPFGVDDTGAYCGNAVSQGDASATQRNGRADADRAMKAGAAAVAVDAQAGSGAAAVLDWITGADEDPDACLPDTMDASAVATGFRPVEDGGSACLVAHDGPIRAVLNHYLGVSPEKWWTLSTTHGGVSLVEFAGGCVTIRFVNATGHLDGLEPDRYVPSDGD
jgi:glucosyl-3-phosphoglycerate phosphatase